MKIVLIYTQGNWRYIVANGIPNHGTGAFLNRSNPNTISPADRQRPSGRPQTTPSRLPPNDHPMPPHNF